MGDGVLLFVACLLALVASEWTDGLGVALVAGGAFAVLSWQHLPRLLRPPAPSAATDPVGAPSPPAEGGTSSVPKAASRAGRGRENTAL